MYLQKSTIFPLKKPCLPAKEPCEFAVSSHINLQTHVMTMGEDAPYVSAKEPYFPGKEPCLPTKGPSVFFFPSRINP